MQTLDTSEVPRPKQPLGTWPSAGRGSHAQESGELGVTFIRAILDLVLILYGVGQ